MRTKDPLFSGLPPEFREGIPPYRGGFAGVRRAGESLIVRGDLHAQRVACSGGPATIHTVDTVRVTLSTNIRFAEFFLDHGYGVFAPGATDEGDGSSEIEFDLDVGARDGGASLVMTAGPDAASVGSVDGRHAANLNADEAVPDADVVSSDQIALYGVAGDDLLDARPGLPGFDGPVPGGRSGGASLDGGGGDDQLSGSDSSDGLFLGAGRDRVEGGAGRELIWALDGQLDFVDCGPAVDPFTIVDRRDELHRCEDREFEDPFEDFEDFDRPIAPRAQTFTPMPLG